MEKSQEQHRYQVEGTLNGQHLKDSHTFQKKKIFAGHWLIKIKKGTVVASWLST